MISYQQIENITSTLAIITNSKNTEKIEQYKTILKEELTKANIKHSNHFSFLGYDPPYQVENRRNEVVVELIDYK